jgi:hypothetical protein
MQDVIQEVKRDHSKDLIPTSGSVRGHTREVLDLAATARVDVDRLLAVPQISLRISVSGHVYDVEPGVVRTVIAPTAPRSAQEVVSA